jgi:hypothetical protein
MVCVVLTPRILEVVDSFDSFCNKGRVRAAMTVLINPSLTEDERKTLFEEFGEHLRTRMMILQTDISPCDVIHFYTLSPCARKAFTEEVKKRMKEAHEAFVYLCAIEERQGEYERLIRAFVARHHKVTSCGQTMH